MNSHNVNININIQTPFLGARGSAIIYLLLLYSIDLMPKAFSTTFRAMQNQTWQMHRSFFIQHLQYHHQQPLTLHCLTPINYLERSPRGGASSLQYHTLAYRTTLWPTNITLWPTIPRSGLQYHTRAYSTTLWPTIPRSDLQYHALAKCIEIEFV